MIYALHDLRPRVHPTAWVHPAATVVGDVMIGASSSIWPGAVLRGDFGRIEIGERTSVQDNAVVHAAAQAPTWIGSDCVVGHGAVIEGALIEDAVLVASRSVVLRAIVRCGGSVAAGAVVLDGVEVRAGERAQGVPARIAPSSTSAAAIRADAAKYVEMARRHGAATVPL